jgi:thioredoxin-related protein
MRLISILLMTLLLAPAARSAELVVFEQKACVWCQRFDREIAPAYDKTTEGKRAPLRRQDISQPVPAELAFIQRERFTPVFVLIDGGREIGRIRGYPGDTFFWGLLANLLERLDRGETAPPPPAETPPRGVTFGE